VDRVIPVARTCMWIACVLLQVVQGADTAWGQTATPQGAAAQSATPMVSVTEPPYPKSRRVPEEMMRRRPRQVIALPSEPGEYGQDKLQRSAGVLGKLPPDVHRLPEGYVVAGRQMAVERQADWVVCYLPDERLAKFSLNEAAGWLGDLDAARLGSGLVAACQAREISVAPEAQVIVEEPGKRWRIADPRRTLIVERDRDGLAVRAALPLRLLPNKSLAMLEAVLTGSQQTPSFAFTGLVTEFQGNNYLLTEHLSQVITVAEEPPSETGGGDASADSAETDATATAPAGDPRPEEIIKQLLERKPRRAVPLRQNVPAVAQQEPPPVRPDGEARVEQVWPEETLVVDQPGRIVPSEQWWMFAFEDKGHQASRRPVRLLPNRMLENAIALAGDESMGVVLTVSGELTEYHGTNYLLLRKVLVQRDWGNLK